MGERLKIKLFEGKEWESRFYRLYVTRGTRITMYAVPSETSFNPLVLIVINIFILLALSVHCQVDRCREFSK